MLRGGIRGCLMGIVIVLPTGMGFWLGLMAGRMLLWCRLFVMAVGLGCGCGGLLWKGCKVAPRIYGRRRNPPAAFADDGVADECFSIARMYKGKMPVLPVGRVYGITSPEVG